MIRDDTSAKFIAIKLLQQFKCIKSPKYSDHLLSSLHKTHQLVIIDSVL